MPLSVRCRTAPSGTHLVPHVYQIPSTCQTSRQEVRSVVDARSRPPAHGFPSRNDRSTSPLHSFHFSRLIHPSAVLDGRFNLLMRNSAIFEGIAFASTASFRIAVFRCGLTSINGLALAHTRSSNS